MQFFHQVIANKSRLKSVDDRQTEVAVSWLKERDDLKSKLSDMNDKVYNSKRELSASEERFKQKEKEIVERAEKDVAAELKKAKDELSTAILELRHANETMKSKAGENQEALQKVDFLHNRMSPSFS